MKFSKSCKELGNCSWGQMKAVGREEMVFGAGQEMEGIHDT